MSDDPQTYDGPERRLSRHRGARLGDDSPCRNCDVAESERWYDRMLAIMDEQTQSMHAIERRVEQIEGTMPELRDIAKAWTGMSMLRQVLIGITSTIVAIWGVLEIMAKWGAGK